MNNTDTKLAQAIDKETKPIIHLCEKHYQASDWNDKEVILTGRQSCDICKER